MASDSPTGKKLKPTLDFIQKRFWCGEDELLVWRNSLMYRYFAITNSSIKVVVNEYDQNETLLPIPSSQWIQGPPPPDLAKTVIRLYYYSSKRITLTLYFTQNSAGTLLCQGKDCATWDTEECEALKQAIVKHKQCNDIELLTKTLLSIPVTFMGSDVVLELRPPILEQCDHRQVLSLLDAPQNKAASPPHLQKVAASVHEKSPPVPPTCTTQSISPTSSSPCHSNMSLLCEVNVPENSDRPSVIILPPTPSLQTPTTTHIVDDKAPHSISTGHQEEKKHHRGVISSHSQSKRHAFCSTPQRLDSVNHLPSVRNKLECLEEEMQTLSSAQLMFEERITCLINDSKNATKNELRVHISEKINELKSHLDTLTTKISLLEEINEKLSKENQSLRTRFGSLHSDLKRLKSQSGESKCTQTSEGKIECNTLQLSHIPMPVADSSPSAPSPASDGNSSTPKDTNHNGVTDIGNDKHIDKTASQSIELSNNTVEHNTVPIFNRYNVLAEENHGVNIDYARPQTDITQHMIPNGQAAIDSLSRQNTTEKSRPSPREVLSRISIPDRTTLVLIGDSVIRYISPSRFAPRSETMYKVYVPGMQTTDLCCWLQSISQAPNVRTVIVHVGVNNCPSGQITKDDWSALIMLCQHVFPQAAVAFSSILPARGRHNLNNAIIPSNRNLQSVCRKLQVLFIDHSSTFTATTGAPRLILYHNLTHPSVKGTSKLAANLKRSLYQWKEHEHKWTFARQDEPPRLSFPSERHLNLEDRPPFGERHQSRDSYQPILFPENRRPEQDNPQTATFSDDCRQHRDVEREHISSHLRRQPSAHGFNTDLNDRETFRQKVPSSTSGPCPHPSSIHHFPPLPIHQRDNIMPCFPQPPNPSQRSSSLHPSHVTNHEGRMQNSGQPPRVDCDSFASCPDDQFLRQIPRPNCIPAASMQRDCYTENLLHPYAVHLMNFLTSQLVNQRHSMLNQEQAHLPRI